MGLIDRIALFIGRLLSWGFLAIAGMMGYEVISRYLFSAPTYWAHELAGLLGAFAFISGGAFCMVEGSHMRVDVLTERLGSKAAALVEGLSLLCGIIYLAAMSYAAWGITRTSLFRFSADGMWMPERSGSTWNTPEPGILKLALLLGSVLFLLVTLRRLALLVQRGRR